MHFSNASISEVASHSKYMELIGLEHRSFRAQTLFT